MREQGPTSKVSGSGLYEVLTEHNSINLKLLEARIDYERGEEK